MFIAFGVIVFLVLVLAYVVNRNQGIQRAVKQAQSAHKSLTSQNKHTTNIMLIVTTQLQHSLQTQLHSLKKHALINQADFNVVSGLIENFRTIIMSCSQGSETIETALQKALQESDLSMDSIREFIVRQPSEVRLPWSQNSIEGFVAACQNMTAPQTP
ncbi:hypothetical protein [Paraglaciecola sp. 2405UD69-4]|uniref:hypothetical protein n=1 Tax=Paraglaciecola sp. 2405UD69-4 TaxID=3391836 RepID=UPI0039C947A9